MKFLLLNWGDRKNPLGGGAEIHLEEIFSRISAKGHEVTLLSSKFPGAEDEELVDGIHIIRTGSRSFFNFQVRDFYIKNLRHHHFDLVVDDINKIPFYSPLWVRQPVLPVIPHLFGTTVFREVPFPLACYVHLWEKPLLKVYGNNVIEVLSDSTKQDLINRGFDPDKIEVILCGIDHDKYSPEGLKSSTPLIVYVGRIKKYKGIDIALRAFKQVLKQKPESKFVIVGSGDALKYLTNYASKLLPEQSYTFTGYVSEQEKVDWLRKAHLLLNPSEKEGWGLTGVEANACGTVVVASDSPGIRDSIINQETGILVPHGDHNAMAVEILNFLNNPELLKKFQRQAVARTKQLTWDLAAAQTLDLIERVIK
ncbi:MAG: glycosyltransferase family 4 protein [bacterium]